MNSLAVIVAVLIGSAVVIYLSCELFVNGVEWVGRRLAMGQTATGSVLAAFGTALPESVVTFVAVAIGATASSKALGVGAALGGPLALSTIAYATVGIVLFATRRKLPKTLVGRAELRRLGGDQGWFLVLFAAKIAAGLVVFRWKPWLGIVFLLAYACYVRREIAHEGEGDEGEIEPLRLRPRAEQPATWAAIVQTLAALAVIFVASRMFVAQLGALAPRLGLSPQLVALLLSPIATELPETMNAVIWVRQGKYRLALANISGAMMIQATVPTAFGLFFTPWLLDPPLLLGAAVTAAAVALLFVGCRTGRLKRGLLATAGLFYLLFVALLLGLHLAR